MPVFAIEAGGVDGNGEPDNDIETLAQHYIGRIWSLQPNGPYFLLGHSFGRMVVSEMAQRLLAIGERIACLILLDTLTAPIVATPFLAGELRLATAGPSQTGPERLGQGKRDPLSLETEFAPTGYASHFPAGEGGAAARSSVRYINRSMSGTRYAHSAGCPRDSRLLRGICQRPGQQGARNFGCPPPDFQRPCGVC